MSKFYTLFAACSKREISGFHKSVRQSHGKRTDLLELLRYIRNVHGSPDAESKLEPAYCCREIYVEESKGNYRSVLNMMSELHLMLKGYLLSESIKKDVLENRSLWLSILLQKGLEKEFSGQAHSNIREYETSPKFSIMDYWNLLALQHMYYYNFTNTSEVDGLNQLQKSLDALEQYTQVLKSRMLCEALQLKGKLPADSLIDSLVERLRVKEIKERPINLLQILYQELRILLETNDFGQFDRITKIISKNAAKIAPKELDEFILYLNSFLSTIGRTGQSIENMERAHRVNRIALENKVYFHQGKMRASNYLNVVTAACRVEDFKWALHFADTCNDLLPEQIRQDAYSLSKATIHFEKREYKQILKLLEGVESRDVYIQIRVKAFMIVCHFELNLSDGDLLEYCAATEAYLKRNPKLQPYKDAVVSLRNMIRIVKMLQSNNQFKEKIVEEISQTGLLILRQWLLEKATTYRKW